MNNKGFTLVELVATIALLAVISVISFVSINTVVSNSKISNCEKLVQSIKTATKEYVSENRYNSSFDSNNDKIEWIDADTLINGHEKYLVGPIVNPFNNEVITASDISIRITLNGDYSANEINVYNKMGNKVNCESGSW